MSNFQLTEANFRRIYDFIPGLPFCDIMPLLKDKDAYHKTIDQLAEKVLEAFPGGVDYVACVELRGVPFGPTLAYKLNAGLVIIRKKGKLPGPTYTKTFIHDYAEDALQIQVDAIKPGSKVVVVDDLVSTGGTLKTACELLFQLNATVLGCFAIIEVPAAPGRENFERDLPNVPLYSLVKLAFYGKKPQYDPADAEKEKKEFDDFLKGLWKDEDTAKSASKGLLESK